MKVNLKNCIRLLLLILPVLTVQAQEINDKAALADLKAGKGVFLIDIGDAKKMNF